MTTTQNAANGGKKATDQSVQREHGLVVLRNKEAKALIGLATDALSEALNVGWEISHVFYQSEETTASLEDLSAMRDDALACLSTSEHYLLMLGSVLEDQAGTGGNWAEQAPYPLYISAPEATDAS